MSKKGEIVSKVKEAIKEKQKDLPSTLTPEQRIHKGSWFHSQLLLFVVSSAQGCAASYGHHICYLH